MTLFGFDVATFVSIIGGIITGITTIGGYYHKYYKKRNKYTKNNKNKSFDSDTSSIDFIYTKQDLSSHRIFFVFSIVIDNINETTLIKDSCKSKILNFIDKLNSDLLKNLDNFKNNPDKSFIRSIFIGIIQNLDNTYSNDNFLKIRIRMMNCSINNILLSSIYDNHLEMIWAILSSIATLLENIVNDAELWSSSISINNIT